MATGNSVNDEIREQREKVLKENGFKGRLEYFVYYYKWHVIIGAIILFFGGSMLYEYLTQKDVALQVVYVNGFPNVESTEFMADFQKTIEINEDKEETLLDDTIYINADSPSYYDEQSMEKLLVMCSAGTVDVCIVDESYFMKMAEGGYFLDLSTVLSAEQMEEYADRMIWYDCPDNIKEGEEAIAIEVTNASKIVSTQSFPNTKCYYGILVNSERIDNSLAFLEYIETP